MRSCIFEIEKMRMNKLVYIFLVFLVFGCNQKKRALLGDTDFQKKMNTTFKDASKSPLKEKDLKDFKGLNFFEFDSTFIVTAELRRTPESDFFEMPTTTGKVSQERVYGVLKFELKGKSHQLEVYQGEELITTEGFENYLFLPFIDDSNGDATYGGGRYIDLRIPQGNTIEIDFNQAYNPYCAYNEKYSCPIVPRVNYMPIKVEAGVKLFKKS